MKSTWGQDLVVSQGHAVQEGRTEQSSKLRQPSDAVSERNARILKPRDPSFKMEYLAYTGVDGKPNMPLEVWIEAPYCLLHMEQVDPTEKKRETT